MGAAWLLLPPSHAHGESTPEPSRPEAGPVAVLWVTRSSEAEFASTSGFDLDRSVEAALGAAALGPAAAAERFATRGSRRPVAVTLDESEALLADAQQLQVLIATERYRRAERVAGRLMERARQLRDRLSRDAALSEHMYRGCLYRVQGALQRGARPEARNLAAECRRLAPHASVEVTEFPPRVVGLVAEVDAELRLTAREVRILSAPADCPVYLNGRRIGQSPVTIGGLIPGRYTARADCEGRTGRLHPLRVGPEPVTLSIDTRFDARVHTDGPLRLLYPDAATQRHHLPRDLHRVGRTLGASALVAVSTPTPQANGSAPRRLEWWTNLPAAHEPHAVAVLPAGADSASCSAALAGLRHGRSFDARPEPPRGPAREPRPPATAPDPTAPKTARAEIPGPSPPTGSGPENRTWPGIALGAVGAMTLAGSWAAYGWQRERERELARSDPARAGYLDRVEERNVAQTVLTASAIAGSALATAALPWLWSAAAPSEGPPWWSWAVGAAGVGLLGWGLGLFALDGTCSRDGGSDCPRSYQTAELATVVSATAVPLIGLPLSYWLGRGLHPGERSP